MYVWLEYFDAQAQTKNIRNRSLKQDEEIKFCILSFNRECGFKTSVFELFCAQKGYWLASP